MHAIEKILKKLNSASTKLSVKKQLIESEADAAVPGGNVELENQLAGAEMQEAGPVSLTDIMRSSFAEVRELAGDTLAPGEIDFLYEQSREQLKKHKLAQIRSLPRANTMAVKSIRPGASRASQSMDYNQKFEGAYAKPGFVASMFSPAAYLTELYREAKDLHPDTSDYHLDKRRPDLAALKLSESNMNQEVSTLSLSNEILIKRIQQEENKNYDEVMEMFATDHDTAMASFNLHYATARQAMLLKNPELSAFTNAPEIKKLIGPASLLAMQKNISPAFYQILAEAVNQDNAVELFKKNFGNVNVERWCSKKFISQYYGIADEELSALLNLLVTDENELNLFLHLIDDDNEKDFTTPKYINDQMVMLSPTYEVDATSAILIKRTYLDNPKQVHYAEIFPEDIAHCYFNYSIADDFKVSSLQLGTGGAKSYDLCDSGGYEKDVEYSVPINLGKERLTLGVTIGITRWIKSGGFAYNSAKFQMTSFCFEAFILQMNKFIRFYKATGMSLSEMQKFVDAFQGDTSIDSIWMNRFLYLNLYMKRYSIGVNEALVLCNANIGDQRCNDKLSAFDRLFNSSKLTDNVFCADGSTFVIKSDSSSSDFRQAILKQAFQVNDNELLSLLRFTCGYANANMISCELDFLSALYRVRLLADVHNLMLSELFILLSLFFSENGNREKFGKFDDDLGYWIINYASLSDENLAKVIDFLYLYTRWLKEKQWSVRDVYIMTAPHYSSAMIPALEDLLTTLLTGFLSAEKFEGDIDPVQINLHFAPYIAEAIQLGSNQIALSILNWLDQIKPGGLLFTEFLFLMLLESDEEDITSAIAAFYQVMTQLSLIVRSVGLKDNELTMLVNQPGLLQHGMEKLELNLAKLRNLARFHDRINQFGEPASTVLTALNKGELSPDDIAQLLNCDSATAVQAFKQVNGDSLKLSSWDKLDTVLQWIAVSKTFNITPDGLAAVMKITSCDQLVPASFQDWAAVSHLLQGGLSNAQSENLMASLEEKISLVLSTYYIRNHSPVWLSDRETLYSYFLIDNQVSAQIKTTRMAEAINAIQLYVNRTVAGMEADPAQEIIGRPFFIDWEKYNKRFHTWAGAALLAYYPENYVDPLNRIGQTEMFNELLQSISQTELNIDTVEDAFKTYMTRFENIANLTVVSGYHDAINSSDGLTYFIGKSVAEGECYYWRILDHHQFLDGKFPANAWREWKKIAIAISPVNEMVRPVVFKSRLHIVWVEKKTITTNETVSNQYQLKISNIMHDGSWSSPCTIELDKFGMDNLSDSGMYCAQINNKESLNVIFYTIQESTEDSKSTSATGIFIYADGSVKAISSDEISRIKEHVYPEFDIKNQVRINNVYNQVIYADSSADPDARFDKGGTDNLSKLDHCRIFNIVVKPDDETKTLSLKADANLYIAFDGEGDRQRAQCNLMKRYGKVGDRFFIYNKYYQYEKSNYYTGECVYSIYQFKAADTGKGRLLSFCEAPFTRLDVLFATLDKLSTNYPNQVNYGYIDDNSDGDDKYKEKIDLVAWEKPMSSLKSKTVYSNGYEIDTEIDLKNIEIVISAGKYSKTFTADQFVEKSRKPALSFGGMIYPFTNLNFDIPLSEFTDNSIEVSVTFRASTASGRSLGEQTCLFSIAAVPLVSNNILIINRLPSGAQFLQYGPYRIRLNTLFAQKLVARANSGIDSVLSKETQSLPEPSLGDGGYMRVTLPRYEANQHGASRQVKLTLWRGREDDGETGFYHFWSGSLTDLEQNITLFVPLTSVQAPFYSSINFPYSRIGGLTVYLTCDKGRLAVGKLKTAYENGHLSLAGYTPAEQTAANIALLQGYTEPMDFNEANALYFWEMFYYAPMMVFKRFLQEQRFEEAARWIKYIWSPEGYYVDGRLADYTWNCRPLEEDTSWNSNPRDLTDPDALAQHDPMHYKVATFMNTLDLLIARGDACYRQLEPDTLNEAKIWYVQARTLLGQKPVTLECTQWQDPQLNEAADSAVSQSLSEGILLTAPFLPQQNEKMLGYWQLLEQRMYNLRHNLSIDGQALSLPIYANPADPVLLHNNAVTSSQDMKDLPKAMLSLYRFPVILESARNMLAQLMQFGSALLGVTERQDAEALAELLQTQGDDLSRQSIDIQQKTLAEIDADKTALLQSRSGAQSRFDSYRKLYDENINPGEKRAMDLYNESSALAVTGTALHMTAASLDLMPNIFGLADGGCRWGAAFNALAIGKDIVAGAMRIDADKISQSEAYRRRRQEWEIQRNAAESEVKQIDAQLAALDIHREAAILQKNLLETQQAHAQTQLAFLRTKLSNKALYYWLRGRLAAIYNAYYDLTVSRCLMAEKAWQWHFADETVSFISPANAGFLAGESLMLNLAQMEKAYLEKDKRALEVTRTVSLAEFYAGLPKERSFVFTDQTVKLLSDGTGAVGSGSNMLQLADEQLSASIKLSDLKINSDYPADLGSIRRIKQISVTLPALLGPYQDVRAVLGYGGSVIMPRGCNSIAVSHGMNDSGQFQLDFNDPRYLPFEGIPVNDGGNLTLNFPDATGGQKALLLSLSDVILHIRYTIQN